MRVDIYVDVWMHQRLNVLGVKYALGERTVEELAEILQLPIADTVALLEEHGYSRPLAQIALTERTRSDLYARLREHRRTRSGKLSADPNRVARTVVASQRIEGIDARPWMPSLVK